MKRRYKIILSTMFFLWMIFPLTHSVNGKMLQETCETPIILPQGTLFMCGSIGPVLTVSNSFASYKWFRNGEEIAGETNATYQPTETGIFKVAATDTKGCTMISKETMVLEITEENKLPIENILVENGERTENGFRFCYGETLYLTILGNFNQFVWNFSGTDPSSPTVAIKEPGTYQFSTKMEGNCILSNSFVVTTYAPPVVAVAASDTIFKSGKGISLTATGALEYVWSPAEGLSNAHVSNPVASPLHTTTYTVTGYGANGCGTAKSITLHLQENSLNIFPPKVFSPNNDGREDVWYIENMDSYPNCEVIVFNRRGVQVFGAKPYHNNWDGTFKGNPVPAGDYYYVIRAGGKENLKTGSVLIVR